MNLYAYVRNDPINLVDPMGLSCEEFPGGWFSFRDNNGDGKYDEGIDDVVEIGVCGRRLGTGGGLGGMGSTGGGGTVGSGGGGNAVSGAKPQKTQQCALEADRLGKGAGTVAAATVAGAQGGPVGALAGLGIGVGVVLAQDLLPEKFGSLVDSGGAAASGGIYGFLSSQYDRVFKSVFSNAPGVAHIGGGAVANVAQHVMRTGALTGAVGAARWGAAAGVGYLGGYLATYQLTYNACMKGS